MSTIPEQPSKEHNAMLESLGPYFFSRVFKEEGGGSGSDAPDATLYDIYHIELSATALGFLDAEKNDQQTVVGSATVSLTETRFQGSKDVYRSCKIDQLNVETGNILTNMEAFATMLRRIQSFCIKHYAEHLAMAPTKGSCWFSGLLKPAGFNLRDCDRLDKPVGAGLQLCAVLSTPPMEVPAEGRVLSSSTKSANKPVKEPAKGPSIKAGRRREQESGPVAEGSPFGESSLPQHQEIDVSPAAAEEVTSPEGLVENSPQPRVRGPFEVQALIDSVKNEAPALSQTINTPPAAKIARMLGPLPKKEYCMYWIRRGECDYMQSGCRYKHEMPLDEETRQRIGLREIPGWFKECPEYERFLLKVDQSATGTLTDVGSGKKDLFRAQSSGRDANKVNNPKAVKSTADRRFDRGIYRPPGATMSSSSSDRRAAPKESSKVQDIEEPSRGQARSGGEIRIKGASSTRSGVFKKDVPSPRSAADSPPSIPTGRMKRRNSSPSSDDNDQRARPGRKEAKRGRNNGRAGN